jgi:transcriptional regulator with XRE-family HTH domain
MSRPSLYLSADPLHDYLLCKMAGGLSAGDLAERLQVSVRTIWRWLRYRSIDLNTADRICNILSILPTDWWPEEWDEALAIHDDELMDVAS